MKLYIMCAVPGAGKGWWIKHNKPKAVVCSADHHFYELGGGEYAFDPSQLGIAHGKCRSKAESAMIAGEREVIIDNTNLHAKHIGDYVALARKHSYDVEIVRITPSSFDAAFERNLHGLPKEAHDRMVEQFNKRSLPKGVAVIEVNGG